MKKILLDIDLFTQLYTYLLVSEKGKADPATAVDDIKTLFERVEHIMHNMDDHIVKTRLVSGLPDEDYYGQPST